MLQLNLGVDRVNGLILHFFKEISNLFVSMRVRDGILIEK